MDQKIKLLNEREVAEYLNVASGTLRQWRHVRRGPPFHSIGGVVRYSLEDVNNWLRERRRLGDDDPPQDGE